MQDCASSVAMFDAGRRKAAPSRNRMRSYLLCSRSSEMHVEHIDARGTGWNCLHERVIAAVRPDACVTESGSTPRIVCVRNVSPPGQSGQRVPRGDVKRSSATTCPPSVASETVIFFERNQSLHKLAVETKQVDVSRDCLLIAMPLKSNILAISAYIAFSRTT